MKNIVFFWLICALITIIGEMGSPGLFYFLSFSIGACLAALSAVYVELLAIQIALFVISTIGALWVLHVWIRKTTHHTPRTNVYALIGKRAQVITTVKPYQTGAVKIDGAIWTARSVHDDICIEKDAIVEIVRVQGVHVIVQQVNTQRERI